MKLILLTVFAVALFGGCGEHVSSPATEAKAPEFELPVTVRKAAIASAAKLVPVPISEPAGHSERDFKDSAGNLDSSR